MDGNAIFKTHVDVVALKLVSLSANEKD